MVLKGLLELVGRSDSDWPGDSMTRQSVTGYHCDVQGVMMCSRSLKQTAVGLRSCEAEFHAASACAGELLGLAELFKELHHNVTVCLRNGFRRSETTLSSAEDQEDSNTSKFDAWQCDSGSEQSADQWAEWARRTTQQISSRNIWMDRERSRSRRNFDCEFWMIRIVQMVTIDSFFSSPSSRVGVYVLSVFN